VWSADRCASRDSAPPVSSGRLPAVAVVVSFIDCINRGDVEGLGNGLQSDGSLAQRVPASMDRLGHRTDA
jgi:hypothetical protein